MTPRRTPEGIIGSLFRGTFQPRDLFPYPSLEPEERERLSSLVERLRSLPARDRRAPRETDARWDSPPALVDRLAALGLFGSFIPRRYGGLGLSQKAYVRISEELCRLDVSVGFALGAHQNLGCRAILLYGSGRQKERWLRPIAEGRLMCAFAMTEGQAGTDLALIETSGARDRSGKFYVLNGRKDLITNGDCADLLVTTLKTPTAGGFVYSTLVVPASSRGLRVGPRVRMVGLRGTSQNSLHFSNVKVPVENRLGREGEGMEIALRTLGMARSGIAFGALGIAKSILELCVADLKRVSRYKKPLSELGMIRQMVSRIGAQIFALESAGFLAAHCLDTNREDSSLECAASKIFGSEALTRIAALASLANGSRGSRRDFPYAAYLQDSYCTHHIEGANDFLRSQLAVQGFHSGRDFQEYAPEISLARLVPKPLIGHARAIDSLLSDFSKTCKRLSGEPASVVRSQLRQRRISEIVIDLYVLLCALSSASAAHEDRDRDSWELVFSLWRILYSDSIARLGIRLRGLRGSQADDDEALLLEASDGIYAHDGYPFDPTSVAWRRPGEAA